MVKVLKIAKVFQVVKVLKVAKVYQKEVDLEQKFHVFVYFLKVFIDPHINHNFTDFVQLNNYIDLRR